MSAVARDFVYVVKTTECKTKQIPVVDKERIERAKKNVAPLREKQHGNKN